MMRLIRSTVMVTMIVALGLALSGCPASMSGGSYTRGQARQAQDVQLGYVQNVRQVMIEGTKSGVGAVSGAALGGCNFGVLLPWWDMLFGTANFRSGTGATGIRDQVEPDAQGRVQDYGRGFWAQQWLGLRRLFGM